MNEASLDSNTLLFNREYTSRSKQGRPTFSLRDSMNRECLGSSNVIPSAPSSDRVYGASFTPFPTRENIPPRSDGVVIRKSFAFDEKGGSFRDVTSSNGSSTREKANNSHYSTSSGWKRRSEKDSECCKNCHLCTQSHTTDKWAVTMQERQLRPDTNTREPLEGYYPKHDGKQYRPYSPDTKSMMQKLVGYKEDPQDPSLPMYKSTNSFQTPTVGYYMNQPKVEQPSTKQIQPNTYPKNPSQMQPYNTNTIYLSNNPISVKSVTLNSKYDPASRYSQNPEEPNNFFQRVRMGRMYSDSTPWEYYLHYNEDDDEKKEMYEAIKQRCAEYAKTQTKKEDRKSRICMETAEFKNIVEKLTRKETSSVETQTAQETDENENNKENISTNTQNINSANTQSDSTRSKKSENQNQTADSQSKGSQKSEEKSLKKPKKSKRVSKVNSTLSLSSTTSSSSSLRSDTSNENRVLSITNGPPSTNRVIDDLPNSPTKKKLDIPKGIPVFIAPKKAEVVKKIVTNMTSNKKKTSTTKMRKKSSTTEPRKNVSQNTTSNSSYLVSDKAAKTTTVSDTPSKKPDKKFKKSMKRIEDTKKKAEWLDKYIALLSSPEKSSVKKRMESSSRHTSPKKSDSSQITLQTTSEPEKDSNPYSFDFDEVYSGLPSTVSTAIATSKSVQKCFDSVLNYFEKSKYISESSDNENVDELDDNVSLSSMTSELEISLKYNITNLSSEDYDDEDDEECSILNEFTPDTSYLVNMNNSSESITTDNSFNTISIGSQEYSCSETDDFSKEFNISNMSI